MMSKKWKKEVARDALALGSIPFYFIVLVRAVIGQYTPFLVQLIVSFVLLYLLYWILKGVLKNSNLHIARALIIVVFTSLFYQELIFTVFAVLLWFMLILSAAYLKIKRKEILLGILSGILATVAGYLVTLWVL
ncbi:hypothetical protein ACFL96_11025 [Thermoproteota archaeon]